jgi:hypothetical protein
VGRVARAPMSIDSISVPWCLVSASRFRRPRPPLHLVASDLIAEDVIRLTYVPA